MMTVYIVFQKLEQYYDDNDKTFIEAFSTEERANDFVKKYSQYWCQLDKDSLIVVPYAVE